MKIGYSQAVITPSLDKPVFLAGFGNDRRAQTIHDDLTVRALAIQDGQTTLVLAALDLVGFFRPDVQEVIRRVHEKHPQAQIVIASTHTHHGPDTMGLWGPDMKTCGVDPGYLAGTKDRIVSCIHAALDHLQECDGIRTTSVLVPGLVKNARDPGILDDELTLLQFTGRDGSPLATLFNFPCHPEVLWEHNPHITADYPGSLRAEVERQSGAPCIFFSGALGGMLTPDVIQHSFEEAEGMGRKLAWEGLQALNKVERQAFKISIKKKEIKVRLTNILYKIAFRRKLLPDVRDRRGCVTTEVNLVRIGGLWLGTVPGELLPKLGLRVKAHLLAAGAQVAGIIGLANDELGYILPVEDFKYPWNPFKPGGHYEETNSIGKTIGPVILDGLHDLLQQDGS